MSVKGILIPFTGETNIDLKELAEELNLEYIYDIVEMTNEEYEILSNGRKPKQGSKKE